MENAPRVPSLVVGVDPWWRVSATSYTSPHRAVANLRHHLAARQPGALLDPGEIANRSDKPTLQSCRPA